MVRMSVRLLALIMLLCIKSFSYHRDFLTSDGDLW